MKKVVLALLILVVAIIALPKSTVFATDNSEEVEDELSQNIELILDELDLESLEQYLESLSPEQQGVFGGGSAADNIRRIVSGEITLDYSNFFGYLFEVIGINILQFLPLLITILVISIAFNLIASIKGKFASDSVENIVHFACVSLVVIVVVAQIVVLINNTLTVVMSLQKQMNIVFPIILTLMSAIGASGSVAVYQPSVAILSAGIMEMITLIILPFFILSIVFTIVGNLSEAVKLKKMSSFFSTTSKWLLGTSFFLFLAFLSIQGITASIYDGISVRTAKFAISKYVPIIGGYLSEGLNLIMAGSVLIKNAVGMTAVIMLFVSVVPIVVQIVVFSLSLNLAGAIIEPLGNSKISSLLTELGKNMNSLIAMILGAGFLYFIFLILIVCTGNLAI